MILTLISTIFLIGIGAYVLMWILDNVTSETIKTASIAIYGFEFIFLSGKLVVEAFLKSL